MKLGETRVKVTVHGPKGSEVVEMLADTGASHTMISNELAERLGIEPVGEHAAELADGSVQMVKFGYGEVQIGSEKVQVRLFMGQADRFLLGLSTLETLGFKVNPVKHVLEPEKVVFMAVAC